MERAPGSHHLSRGPAQGADDRICHPEDRCNTGRKPHVEPFAILSLSLSWWRSHANRALRKCVFHAHTLRAQPTKVRSTVTAHPQASVCRLGDCFLRPDFRAPLSLLARPDDARDPERLARLERALDMRGPMERNSIEFAVRHLSSFTITSPAALLSITRSRRRMDIEARTECQMGILSDYGNYSL